MKNLSRSLHFIIIFCINASSSFGVWCTKITTVSLDYTLWWITKTCRTKSKFTFFQKNIYIKKQCFELSLKNGSLMRDRSQEQKRKMIENDSKSPPSICQPCTLNSSRFSVYNVISIEKFLSGLLRACNVYLVSVVLLN